MAAGNIRKIRRMNDLSGTEVAEKLNISAQYYYDLETGKRNLSAQLAQKIAKLFEVSVEDLLDDNTEYEDNKISENKQPYYALTEKDERDIAKRLEKMLAELESDSSLAFMGEPMDDEDRELLRISLENTIRMSKEMAKKKFTPKKYRN